MSKLSLLQQCGRFSFCGKLLQSKKKKGPTQDEPLKKAFGEEADYFFSVLFFENLFRIQIW